MSARDLIGKSLAVGTAALFALGIGLSSASKKATHSAQLVVGPQPTTGAVAADTVVVSSFDELQKLVSQEDGPKHIQLSTGVYEGNLSIKRPVTLSGAPGVILHGLGVDSVLSINASDVAIEGLVVRHSGRRHSAEDTGIKAQGERIRIVRVKVEDSLFGIRLALCKNCLVEQVHVVGTEDDHELRGDGIKLWESHWSTVRNSLIENSRDMVVWYTKHATLEGVTVKKSRYGAHFMYAHDSLVKYSHFESNVVGVFVMYSMRVTVDHNVMAGARGAAGIGIGFKDSDAVDVTNNWFVANTKGGYLDNTPRTEQDPVHIDNNVFTLNDMALSFHSTERGLFVRGNDFRDNAALIDVEGNGDALSSDFKGNHYADYEGYDLDGDGTGDVPFEVRAVSSTVLSERPTLRFFHGTAALGLLDVVARAVPILGSRKLLVDSTPLFQNVELRVP